MPRCPPIIAFLNANIGPDGREEKGLEISRETHDSVGTKAGGFLSQLHQKFLPDIRLKGPVDNS